MDPLVIKWTSSKSAKQIADHLGTEHNEIIVNPRDQMNLIEKLPEIYDEPFGIVHKYQV